MVGMDFADPIGAVIPGARGRILSVLAEVTAELNLRTVARLAQVSTAQASRVMPDLVELGLVERRDVPPSSMFRLNRGNEAARVVVELGRLREVVLERLAAAAGQLPIPPASVIVFGSFARRDVDRYSDMDVVFVRPDGVDGEDDGWTAGLDQWRTSAKTMSGNEVGVIEVARSGIEGKLSDGGQLWQEIARDGVVIFGAKLHELGGKADG